MTTEAEVREALREVEDAEFPVSVIDLGLIRGVQVDGSTVRIKMTFTSVACPCSHMMMEDIENRLLELPAVEHVEITEVFEGWSRKDVTPEGRQVLAAIAVT